MVSIDYKKYDFYKRAHEVTKEIYQITEQEFPKKEMYGLSRQLRRASASICSNIAEGAGRSTIRDYKNFLHMALGSAKEVEYQLLLAKDLSYISSGTYDRIISILGGVIGPLTNYLKKMEEKYNEK